MTTQSNPSPFSSDLNGQPIPDAPSLPQGDFQMRTMKDDLAAMQGKGIIEEKNIAPTSISPIEMAPEKPIVSSPEPISFSSATEDQPKTNPFSQPASVPSENVQKIIEEPTTIQTFSDELPKNKPASVKVVIIIIILLIAAIIGLGAYYYFLTQKSQPSSENLSVALPVETPAPTPTPTIEPEPIKTGTPAPAPAPKYSAEKPNYLPIDINTIGATEIKAAFLKVSDELKTETMKSPYEFIVVDSNNNPIAFPIFATASKFNLSPAVLSSLGSDFSVYFYNDGSKPRMGFNIQISNKETLSKELIKQEKTFLTDADFIFLNNVAENKTGVFATSVYGQHSVRFLNTNAAKDLSVDYSITDSRFTISSSKNTERAILDKIDNEKVSTKETTPKSSTSSTTINSNSATSTSTPSAVSNTAIRQ